jgi:hypothetical protein
MVAQNNFPFFKTKSPYPPLAFFANKVDLLWRTKHIFEVTLFFFAPACKEGFKDMF